MSERIEAVSSPQNKYVSLVRALSARKQREKERLFRFDGVKLLCEAVQRGAKLSCVLLREGSSDEIVAKAKDLYGISIFDIDCRILSVSADVFDKLSDEQAPEGVIAVAAYMGDMHRECAATDGGCDYPLSEKILLLDSVRDPLNVGAIIRVAAAMGVDRIVMGRDCADIYSSKTLRASMGALFAMRIDRVECVETAVRRLCEGGRRVFAAALDTEAQRLGELAVKPGDCVVIGNEGHGISRSVIDACSGSVYIPMSSGVESLNAATAAAILVWEFFG